MSVYYYVKCNDCRRYVGAVATYAAAAVGERYPGPMDDYRLRQFLVHHCGHSIASVVETDDDLVSFVDVEDE
jgi:hypothetical protein